MIYIFIFASLALFFLRDSVTEEPKSTASTPSVPRFALKCVGGPLDGQTVACRPTQQRFDTPIHPPVDLSYDYSNKDVSVVSYVRGHVRLPGRATDYQYLYPEHGSELEYGLEYLRRIGVTVGNTR